MDGTSADKKKSKQSQGEGKKKAKKANSSKKKKQTHPLQNLMKTIKNIPGFSIPRTTIRRVLRQTITINMLYICNLYYFCFCAGPSAKCIPRGKC